MNIVLPTLRSKALHQLLRTAAITTSLCLGVALLLTALAGGRGFGLNLLYSLSIGLCCWFFIEGGHRLLDRVRGVAADPANAAWPGWAWTTLLVALGTLAGYSLGATIANAISGRSAPMPWQVDWRSSSASLVISFATAAVATLFFMLQGRLQSERTRAEAAQRQAAEHQLRLLESQLEPHMLFNTLANLRALIALDPPRAQAMLDRLIAYLRATLAASRAERHTLADEFARLEDYLALMQVRMGDRLQVKLELPPALAAQPVPPLLLQPLVENAIQHGLEPCCGEASICVRAERVGARLVLSVRDSGVGVAPGALDAPPRPGHGFGTHQVRERLATLYGSRAEFSLLPAAGGGTEATVQLPAATA
ncbi:sensor histidine kinase [Rivibacter subsaxonicus]|uniref:histidine kinase n=1 Tax=Rivibacter subsaxonicus TaxID=457575 RepID=A0A4Q7W2Q4_9BURK|nr:histidine kinase [Rivibacter subsaxonicus]RZU02999.1 histidine kinase/DNA gyrase B/HSP90-like ATPase [Rivibacter subsaxonicus]